MFDPQLILNTIYLAGGLAVTGISVILIGLFIWDTWGEK